MRPDGPGPRSVDLGGPLLELAGLHAGYGSATVLRGIDLVVAPGEVVVVLGANGAGKTTLMRAIAGLIPHTGDLRVDGAAVRPMTPDRMLRRGVSLVPQGRGTLAGMTVLDNLRVGAVSRTSKAGIETDIDRWLEVFPALARRTRQVAGTLSGGEQQMLAVARGLMSRPRLLLCDEISLGLAPLIVAQLFDVLRTVNSGSATALLLVEQNAELALALGSRVYLLEVGAVAASGPTEQFQGSDAIRQAYLGY